MNKREKEERTLDKKGDRHKIKKIPWKTLIIYYVVGLFWILFSDQIFAFIAGNYNSYILIQSYKGIFYVTATTVMLFFLIRMDYAKTIKLKATKEDLYIQKQFVDEIYDRSNTVILVWNEKNEIIRANRFFLDLFEREEEEVLGQKWYSYIQPEEESFEQITDIRQFMKGITTRKFRSTVKLKSGKELQLLWNASTMEIPNMSDVLVVSFGIDVTAEKKTEELLYEMAYKDRLTGLKNRAVFEEEVSGMIASNSSFTLYYLDLDDFKNLNDVYGHNYGDEFIGEYANRLKAVFPISSIYRWYGDKFLLIQDGMDEEEMIYHVERIMAITRKCWNYEHIEYYPSVSIGITKFPQDGRTMVDMLKNTDLALFRAKEEGKSKTVSYEKSFQKDIEERILIENKLNDALVNQGFKLNFQPIYSLTENRISGMEVLLRWKVDTAGISTGKLIEVAEETGKILFIDFWVVENTFQFIREHVRNKDFMININLSAKTVNSSELLGFLIECMQRYEINPGNVEFEITEHSLIHNMHHTKKLIEDLKKLGFKFSLDDFGTRYSSLNYLCSIPFDSLKIDKSYVDNILEERNEKAVVEQIILLSKRLGLKTIAEGIEREEQLRMVAALGCDFAQGYLMPRPVEPEKMLEILEK